MYELVLVLILVPGGILRKIMIKQSNISTRLQTV